MKGKLTMTNLDQHFRKVLDHRHHLRGLRVLRVTLGFVTLLYLLSNYLDRKLLWSPVDGAYPQHLVQDEGLWGLLPNLYQTFPSNTAFEILFHVSMVVAAMYMVGIGGLPVKMAQYAFVFFIYQQNPLLLDGGDNLTYLVLLYMVLADLSFRPLPFMRKLRERWTPPQTLVQLRNLAHNLALTLVVTQIIVMYLASAMYKVQGRMWQDGTALYYILRVPEFYWPGVSEHIYENGTLVVAITYATVLFQVLFVALVARRDFRPYALLIGATFHIGIALLMGLTSFSMVVIAIECTFLDDAHYEAFARRRAAFYARIRQLVPTVATKGVSHV